MRTFMVIICSVLLAVPAAAQDQGSPPNSLVVDENGLVGIGTENPNYELHVRSDTAKVRIENSGVDRKTNDMLFLDDPDQLWHFQIGSDRTFRFSAGGTPGIELLIYPIDAPYGNGGDMLIAGDFVSNGVPLVPDYVFDDEYKLMPLSDLAVYLDEEKSLPNIPNAKEIAKEGVNVSEMQMKLLEKIEELTLYTIQQQEEIDAKNETIARLTNRYEEIADRLSKLERTNNN